METEEPGQRSLKALVLGEEQHGYCYYLDGKAVVTGDRLELALSEEQWLLGQYEWNSKPTSRPFLLLYLLTDYGLLHGFKLRLPNGALLRWSKDR